MSNLKFKLNRQGVSALMKSNEMISVLEGYGNDIKARCGEGYSTDTMVGKNRANTMIYAETYQAKSDNKKNNTILKALR